MPVPQEIRQVPRPRNTVVIEYKTKTGPHYAVVERKGVVYRPGHNPSPRNGKVIGHIIDGKFVKKTSRAIVEKPRLLAYGAAALAWQARDEIWPDLRVAFGGRTADAAFVVAALLVLFPHVTARRLKRKFEETYLCRLCPDVDLSPEAVGELLARLGAGLEEHGRLLTGLLRGPDMDGTAQEPLPGGETDSFDTHDNAPCARETGTPTLAAQLPRTPDIALGEHVLKRAAAVLADRMERDARARGALEERTFRELLEDLGQCLRPGNAPDTSQDASQDTTRDKALPSGQDKHWENVTHDSMELMRQLELVSFPRPKPGRRRGRPPKAGNKTETDSRA